MLTTEAPTETRPALSCDGMGINGPLVGRIATFRNPRLAREFGPLFRQSQSLLNALEMVLPLLNGEELIETWHVEAVRNVIAEAKP